jgi:hypothetical protein
MSVSSVDRLATTALKLWKIDLYYFIFTVPQIFSNFSYEYISKLDFPCVLHILHELCPGWRGVQSSADIRTPEIRKVLISGHFWVRISKLTATLLWWLQRGKSRSTNCGLDCFVAVKMIRATVDFYLAQHFTWLPDRCKTNNVFIYRIICFQ